MEFINAKNLTIIAGIVLIVIMFPHSSGYHAKIVGSDNDMINVNFYDSNKNLISTSNSFSIINYAGTNGMDISGVSFIDFTITLTNSGTNYLSCSIDTSTPSALSTALQSQGILNLYSNGDVKAWTSDKIGVAQFESLTPTRFTVTSRCSSPGNPDVVKSGYVDILIKSEIVYNYCYQESATSSTTGDGTCGLTYTGANVYSGWSSGSNLIDKIWTTYAYGGNTGSPYYVNYTKPANALPSSLWRVKDGTGEKSLAIPIECWNYDLTKIVLRAWSVSAGTTSACDLLSLGSPCSGVIWSCGYKDGLNWQWSNLRSNGEYGTTIKRYVYEEGMKWNRLQIPPCYQETATQSTACGGLSTGSYSKENHYFNINYSRPVTATSAIWQIKHGLLPTYNLSIPLSCFNYNPNKISLRFFTKAMGEGIPSTSYGQCYNGGWINITSISSSQPGALICSYDTSGRMSDGNWMTDSLYDPSGIGSGWCYSYPEGGTGEGGSVFEEAITWQF
jgi:hypothetical protein